MAGGKSPLVLEVLCGKFTSALPVPLPVEGACGVDSCGSLCSSSKLQDKSGDQRAPSPVGLYAHPQAKTDPLGPPGFDEIIAPWKPYVHTVPLKAADVSVEVSRSDLEDEEEPHSEDSIQAELAADEPVELAADEPAEFADDEPANSPLASDDGDDGMPSPRAVSPTADDSSMCMLIGEQEAPMTIAASRLMQAEEKQAEISDFKTMLPRDSQLPKVDEVDEQRVHEIEEQQKELEELQELLQERRREEAEMAELKAGLQSPASHEAETEDAQQKNGPKGQATGCCVVQ